MFLWPVREIVGKSRWSAIISKFNEDEAYNPKIWKETRFFGGDMFDDNQETWSILYAKKWQFAIDRSIS